MKTILITGCSSGFGLDIARYFLERDWQVVATMRTPRTELLPASPRLRILPLDVNDAGSIARAIEAAGPLDAVVNNAGIGMLGVFESTSAQAMRDIFETNTFGTMLVTQAVVPGMRRRRAGVIVNVTSSVTLKPLPLLATYTASKAAIEAFSESLALELAPFNIRLRIVQPGRSPETRFRENAQPRLQTEVAEPYAGFTREVFGRMSQPGPSTRSVDVAEAVWRAVNEASSPMHIPAGADAVALKSGQDTT